MIGKRKLIKKKTQERGRERVKCSNKSVRRFNYANVWEKISFRCLCMKLTTSGEDFHSSRIAATHARRETATEKFFPRIMMRTKKPRES